MNENETTYIIIADNHDELGLPADYKFTKYRDREVAGKVAQKMADRKGVGFTVTMIVDGVRSEAGRYAPTPT